MMAYELLPSSNTPGFSSSHFHHERPSAVFLQKKPLTSDRTLTAF